MHSLNFDLKVAHSWASELEKMTIDRDAHIAKEWEKILRAFREMNAGLARKDKRIIELLKDVNSLTNSINGLNSKLEEAKLIVVEFY